MTIHINDVPQEAANTIGLTVFSLFQHEHKVTALNFTVQRNTEYEGSVRSKVINFIIIGVFSLRQNFRIPSFFASVLDGYPLTLSTANLLAAVVRGQTTSTSLNGIYATV